MEIIFYILIFVLGFVLGTFTIWVYNQITDKWKIASLSFGLIKKVVSLTLNTFKK